MNLSFAQNSRKEKQSALLSILFSSQNKTFDASLQAFQSAFAPPDRFASLCSALLLLEDSKALLLPQRLATWYILFTCWPQDPQSNPFALFILRACDGSSSTPASDTERAFCAQLLAQYRLKELSIRLPSDYTLDIGSNVRLRSLLLHKPGSIEALKSRYSCLQQKGQQGQGQQEPDVASSLGNLQEPDHQAPAWSLPEGLMPWLRPSPTAHPLLTSEPHWLYPDLHLGNPSTLGGGLVWDSRIGEDTQQLDDVRELISRAVNGPLLPVQQQRVLSALESDPRLAHRLGLLPQHLPALVDHCPSLASALLLCLLRAGLQGQTRGQPCHMAQHLLDVLARSEMSLHGMEVVNRLAASVQLPPEFVQLYIMNCIHSCESTQDKYVQNRLVRLVCVFLQSLIRNRVLAAADLLHELQAFCINFSRIREAAKLFRLLKQCEGGGLQPMTSGGTLVSPVGPSHQGGVDPSQISGRDSLGEMNHPLVPMSLSSSSSSFQDSVGPSSFPVLDMKSEKSDDSGEGGQGQEHPIISLMQEGSDSATLTTIASSLGEMQSCQNTDDDFQGVGGRLSVASGLSCSPESVPVYLTLPPAPDILEAVGGQVPLQH